MTDGEGMKAAGRIDGTDPLAALALPSAAARAALVAARRAAGADIDLLLEGESGAGKEVYARAVHAASRRAGGPFVAVNCGALPETLVEALLFGHERGAFTGASERRDGKFVEADGGVLFLDEIGELPTATQAKLLRALQEREVEALGARGPRRVDIRLIAATNRRLRAEVAAGRFREDLFFRISAFPLRVPALRERADDIPALAERLLADIAAREGAAMKTLGEDALAALRRNDWPGNVREMRNALHRAHVLADGPVIRARHLLAPSVETLEREAAPSPPVVRPLADVEAEHIRFALAACGGRISETARRLGIGRSTLYRKMAGIGIDQGRR